MSMFSLPSHDMVNNIILIDLSNVTTKKTYLYANLTKISCFLCSSEIMASNFSVIKVCFPDGLLFKNILRYTNFVIEEKNALLHCLRAILAKSIILF